jgi:drug/metabolite transporter (DMT)-like permease
LSRIGLATHLGQVFLTKALQAEAVAKVSILNYAGILYALLFGWLFFAETYTSQTFFGIFLVISGVILSIIYNNRKAEMIDENTVG